MVPLKSSVFHEFASQVFIFTYHDNHPTDISFRTDFALASWGLSHRISLDAGFLTRSGAKFVYSKFSCSDSFHLHGGAYQLTTATRWAFWMVCTLASLSDATCCFTLVIVRNLIFLSPQSVVLSFLFGISSDSVQTALLEDKPTSLKKTQPNFNFTKWRGSF